MMNMSGSKSSFLFFGLLIIAAYGNAEIYKCKPEVKHSCAHDKCETETEGFQHAEFFEFNSKTSKISACLWTNCYEGKATLFKDKSSSDFTAIAKLLPTAHRGNSPLTVSLTIGKKGKFTAIWSYGSENITMDMGKYELTK